MKKPRKGRVIQKPAPIVVPVRLAFSEKFRKSHKKLCKWCELLAGIFVGIETHLVPLAIICGIWVLIDAAELFIINEIE